MIRLKFLYTSKEDLLSTLRLVISLYVLIKMSHWLSIVNSSYRLSNHDANIYYFQFRASRSFIADGRCVANDDFINLFTGSELLRGLSGQDAVCNHHVTISSPVRLEQPSCVDEGASFVYHIVYKYGSFTRHVANNSYWGFNFGDSLRDRARVVETEDLLGEGAGRGRRTSPVITVLLSIVLLLDDNLLLVTNKVLSTILSLQINKFIKCPHSDVVTLKYVDLFCHPSFSRGIFQR